MSCPSENKIPASKAIRHVQVRLCTEQMSAIAAQGHNIEDTDKMIENLRSRLKASSQPRDRNIFYRRG